jgi:hypothetical protein
LYFLKDRSGFDGPLAIVDDQVGTCSSELQRATSTDASRSAGYEGDLS